MRPSSQSVRTHNFTFSVKAVSHSPPDVKIGRGTPCSLYILLHLCMYLFCLLWVLLFALKRIN